MATPQYDVDQTFTVPATSGQYAPERLQLNSQRSSVQSVGLLGVTALIESAPSGAAIELWLLRVGGDPMNDADYCLFDSSPVSKTWPLASYRGAQIRMKSGGTGGSATISASAD